MKDGFIRVAAVTPKTVVADVTHNINEMEQLVRQAAERQCGMVVFPELSVTAYTCGDLFRERLLLKNAEQGLSELMQRTRALDLLCFAGVPVAFSGKLYNCCAVFHKGCLLGLAAKSFIPNYSEFYEMRYFAPGIPLVELEYCGQKTCLGTDMLFDCENIPGLSVGVELCEDLWIPAPPSIRLAQNGAAVIVNLSCSDEIVGKANYRRDLVKIHSGHVIAAYVYANSGQGESTTDMVFAGQNIIAENGALLAESKLFTTGLLCADIDLERIAQERLRMNTWRNACEPEIKHIKFSYDRQTIINFNIKRSFERYPFVPQDLTERSERCDSILAMQAAGLATRLRHIGCRCAVLGLSGGLDSTLALLVTVRAFDEAGISREGIHAVSMPCFGTTRRTRKNAVDIAQSLGVHFSEIAIEKAVMQHFKDIGHDPDIHDVTYENAQARERTQVLMDLANQQNGIVVGTGDLSELALGWATYNGDHMSMYGVNVSIPKTLVRYLVGYVADHSEEKLQQALYDVLKTPVSPELLPPEDGVISQKTEDIVGPYDLHDFFLYYMLRFGFSPGKIYRMACRAFEGEFAPDTIKKWIGVFYRRFFSQQFKRSCLPDGPKVGSVTLSPRGDFRMPSDAGASMWLKEIESL